MSSPADAPSPSPQTDETRVWIAQCLCPGRHAILAATDEAKTEAEAERRVCTPLRAQVAALLEANAINPWCALCNAAAETWQYELARTRYRSAAEARPMLRLLEAEQEQVRAVFGDLPRSD